MTTSDNCYAWVIAGASFFVHVVTCGIAYSSGALHIILMRLDAVGRHPDIAVVAPIASLLLGFTVLGGIPGVLFVRLFGYRPTVILGGLVAAGGFIGAGFAEELYQVYLALGIAAGLGFGLALTPSIMVIDQYFIRKRNAAASLALSGVSIGIMVFPVLIFKINEWLEFQGLTFVLAAAALVSCVVSGSLMKPNVKVLEAQKDMKDATTMFEVSLLKNVAFLSLCLSNFLWSFGSSIIYQFLPVASFQNGIKEGEPITYMSAVWLLEITAVSSFLSRSMFLVFLAYTPKFDHVTTFLCTLGIGAILTGLFPEMFKHYTGQVAYACLFGFHAGYWTTFVASVTREILGEFIAYGKGFLVLSIGLGLAGGPPLVGWIVDEESDYHIGFYIAGASLLVSSSIMIICNIKRCYYLPRNSRFLGWQTEVTAEGLGEPHESWKEHLLVSDRISTV